MGRGFCYKVCLFLQAVLSFSNAWAFQEERQAEKYVSEYLLPKDHQIRPWLDMIFSCSRAVFNQQSLWLAGFHKCKVRKYTKLLVTKHPLVPGYVFKIYLDVQRHHKDLTEWHFWSLRCQGVKKVRKLIKNYNLESHFKTPKKWIYRLPDKPRPKEEYFTKRYVLVEEEMDIYGEEENKRYWASDQVTKELLSGLYLILKQIGLSDCVKPDNIPFCKDGKVAFIDTQTFGEKVNFKEFSKYLSEDNQQFWKKITTNSN